MEEGVESFFGLQTPKSPSMTRMFTYISCIKVNGRPILPPLMTREKRLEMKEYKKRALELENMLQSRRRESFSSSEISNFEKTSTPVRPSSLNIKSRELTVESLAFHDTLEHRLALSYESETESERKRWSPLKVDSLNDLRLQVAAADSDSAQETPDTVTASPRLMRQTSYTLLKPGPALQNFLQSDQNSSCVDIIDLREYSTATTDTKPETPSISDKKTLLNAEQKRSNSGRRTWDLRQARENWTSRGLGSESDESDHAISTKDSRNDGSRSKRKSHSLASRVPLSDRVPSESITEPAVSVPSTVRDQLSSLSEMMIALTLRHEQQRRELELMQRAEQEKYEQLFTFKQRQILQFLSSATESTSLPTSLCARDNASFISEPSKNMKNSQSANDNLVKHSLVLNGKAEDTDVDVSILDDPCPVEGYPREMCSVSSRSSTLSHESVSAASPSSQANGNVNMDYYSTQWDRYNKAASVLCAGVRGYLTRRLLRTEQVQSLRRSLMDSIQVCRTLKTASDLGSSDVKFMNSLKRQIFSDWDALYDIFIRKSKTEQLEMISLDRERRKTPKQTAPDSGRRMSAATVKSLLRKKQGMSTSLTLPPKSPSFKRSCFKMSTSLSGALPSRNHYCK